MRICLFFEAADKAPFTPPVGATSQRVNPLNKQTGKQTNKQTTGRPNEWPPCPFAFASSCTQTDSLVIVVVVVVVVVIVVVETTLPFELPSGWLSRNISSLLISRTEKRRPKSRRHHHHNC